MPLPRRLRAACALAALVLLPGACARPEPRPNVLLIVADDLGYNDLAINNGDPDVHTPSLDALAREGVRFTRHYADAVCSPARAVRWEEHADGSRSVRLSGVLIDQFQPDEPAGYPTVCKGRYAVGDALFHALEEPTSLNTLELLPRLAAAGVCALKIEGRQRGAAYVGAVTKVWRQAIDQLARAPDGFSARPEWQQALAQHAEGRQTTLGAYQRGWQ